MTDQVYFIGYRAEQFTGWDGSGSPSYTGVVASDTNETNKLGYINLSTSGNVIWKDLDITDTTNPVYILCCVNITPGGASGDSLGNLFLTDGKELISIRLYSAYPSWNSSVNSSLSSGTYSSGGNITISNTIISTNVATISASSTIDFYIKLYSTTTGFDTIEIVYNIQGSATENILYKGSIPSLSSLKSIFSCYSITTGYTTVSEYFYYCAVANFDLTGSYIDYTQVSAEATYTGWTGTVSTLTTYPLVTNNVANGLYSYNAGDQVTFTPAKSLTAGNGYTTPKCTFIDTTLMSNKEDSGFQAVPIVKSASTSITYTMGSVATPTSTPTDYQWINYQNPSNLSDWSVSDVNTLEFGLKRSK